MQRAVNRSSRPTTKQHVPILPAEGVLAAERPQLQTVGFVFVVVGAIGHDGLPPPLRAALRLAGAEQKPVAELGGHAIQEGPEGFMAALPAAAFAPVGILLDADGDEGGALPLTAAVQVAGFDGVQAGVAVLLWVQTVEPLWCHCEHPWEQTASR